MALVVIEIDLPHVITRGSRALAIAESLGSMVREVMRMSRLRYEVTSYVAGPGRKVALVPKDGGRDEG